MFCKKCKKEIPEGSRFCNHCGAKQEANRSRRQRANGMGTAYKRGKTWTALVVVGWRPPTEKEKKAGKNKLMPIKRTRGGFRTKSDALAYCPTLREQYKGGRQAALKQKKLTFAQVYELVKATPHWSKLSEGTLWCYSAAYNYYKEIYYIPFEHIGIDDLQDCADNCPKGKRTRENMRTLASIMYKYAVPRHISDQNYARYLDSGDGVKGTRPPLSDEHIEIIRQGIGVVPYADYIYCLVYTGFRPNEMLQLELSDYDPVENTFVGGFKTEAGTDRVVTLSPKISDIIRDLASKTKRYIFQKPDGSLMGDDYFRDECFYPALAQLGIQAVPQPGERAKYVPYSCRHSFSNLLKKVQGSETDKAALIGHSDFSMTKKYQSADVESLRKITDAI